jgi:hypothetical protein
LGVRHEMLNFYYSKSNHCLMLWAMDSNDLKKL